MKKITIYEPAMCCPTGLCGVSIDPELLRISTLQNTLKKNGVEMQRFNLSNSPQEFINNKEVNKFINENGAEKLPLTLIDDEIVVTGRYPTDEEIAKLINVTIEQT
ncbi:MAG TPA: arsenite efflux transporter metallochaperone ArsD, partial [Anaerovoracaceae bacterium]|nr:arsenite efflux transporter metallochaperone ArsD [Anaerovoracaceae bacterium]